MSLQESDLLSRFSRYALINTQSVEPKEGVIETHPSSSGQIILLNMLESELVEFGVSRQQIVQLRDSSLIATMPATPGCEDAPEARLVVHVDTSPETSGDGVKLTTHIYSGEDLVLPESGVAIAAAKFAGLEGQAIITSDGTTLLGADDKAGVAAVMEIVRFICKNNMSHGPIRILIFPDEEIGNSSFIGELTEENFGKDGLFLTLDGKRTFVNTNSFYGAKPTSVVFCGHNTHPGEGGLDMRSAVMAASHFAGLISRMPQPWNTSGDQGFVHITGGSGTVEEYKTTMILRSFKLGELEAFQLAVERAAKRVAEAQEVLFTVSPLEIGYVPTKEAIDRHPEYLGVIKRSLAEVGLGLDLQAIRGGTDGSVLNSDPRFADIPAINIGMGGDGFHGKEEFLVPSELAKMANVVLAMIRILAKMQASDF